VTADSTAVVKRIYNNNVLLCEENGTEVVVVGKGIGYTVKAGEQFNTAAAGLRRFVPDKNYGANHVAELMSDASLEETEVTAAIITMARAELDIKVEQRLFLPLLDHLSFAVLRAREGQHIDYPLRWEVEQVFPHEAAVGRTAVGIVRDRLGVQLQEGEWSAFALHFVTAQWAGGELTHTLTMAKTIAAAFSVLEREWRRPIDQQSMSAARFVAHLRYLWARGMNNEQLDESLVDFMAPVRSSYPEAARGAETLAELFGDAMNTRLTSDEVAYLALHASRLYVDSRRE